MRLQCKIFSSRKKPVLEKAVNEWLNNHVVKSDMRFQYTETYLDDPETHIIEHTLVLFYTPIFAEEEE